MGPECLEERKPGTEVWDCGDQEFGHGGITFEMPVRHHGSGVGSVVRYAN